MNLAVRVIGGIVGVGLLLLLVVAVAGFIRFNFTDSGDVVVSEPAEGVPLEPVSAPAPEVEQKPSVVSPLPRSKERVTKKPFGIYIDQATSPVQPERFGGYHTGVDFETFESEAVTAVPVQAICSGRVVAKRTASGYGGVLVTSCVLEGESVTVVYGHLALESITLAVGETVTLGEVIGVLGQGESTETDGERKHLHLGIYKGNNPNILGYVAKKNDLAGWIDPCLFVCQ